jgi:hypothetical protein
MLIVLVSLWLLSTVSLGHGLSLIPGFIILFTTLVFYISLDWYFWCVIKKVYNDTKNNQDMLLTEIEHGEIELQII